MDIARRLGVLSLDRTSQFECPAADWRLLSMEPPATAALHGKGKGGGLAHTLSKVQPYLQHAPKDASVQRARKGEEDLVRAPEARMHADAADVRRCLGGLLLRGPRQEGGYVRSAARHVLAQAAGGTVRNWKARWFVLTHRHLLYYECADDDGPLEGALPVGVIALESVRDADSIVELPGVHRLTKLFKGSSMPFVLELPLFDRAFHMRVTTHKECITWVKLLQLQTYKLLEPSSPADVVAPHAQEIVHPWYDNYERYIGSLPPPPIATASHDLAERRAKYGVRRKNSFIYTEEIRESSRRDVELLRRLLTALSEKSVHYEALKELADLCQDDPALASVQPLLPQCLPAHDILTSARSYAVGVGAARPLEVLVGSLNQLLLDLDSHSVARPLAALSDYYQAVADKVNSQGLQAVKPPVVISGVASFLGQRILHSNAAAALWRTGRDNKHGLHAVVAYGGIHWKRAPSWPGYEFAVDALNKLVTGQGSPSAQLLKIARVNDKGRPESVIYQAASTVDGVLLLDLLEERPELLTHLDAEHFSLMYLMGIMSNLQDGKPDNFIVRFNEQRRSLEIVGIDNDHAFADTLVRNGQGHSINVRNILYFLPHAHHKIDATAKEKFLSHTPEEVLLRWLGQLQSVNVQYLGLQKEGVLTTLDLSELNLPIRLRPGESLHVLQRMHAIRHALIHDVNSLLTHHDLLALVQPEVALIVDTLVSTTITARPDHGLAAFRRLFALPTIESDPDLKRILTKPLLGGSEPLSKILKDNVFPQLHDYTRERTQTIADAISEVVNSLDFAQLGRRSRRIQELLWRTLLPCTPLKWLSLRGADVLDAHALLGALAGSRETLTSLQLERCLNITPKALCDLAVYPLRPIVSIESCPQLELDETLDFLKESGVHITRQPQHPRPPQLALRSVPQHSNDAHAIVALFKAQRLHDALVLLATLPASDIARARPFVIASARQHYALHEAAKQGLSSLIPILVRGFGLDIDAWDVHTCTPLQWAIRRNQLNCVTALLGLGADVNRVGQRQRTALVEAVLCRHEDIALLLLQKHRSSISMDVETDGLPLLHLAVHHGLVTVARLLLCDPVAGIAAKAATSHGSILHVVARARIDDGVFLKELLARAPLTALDPAFLTPVQACAESGSLTLLKLILPLLEDPRGAVHVTTSDGRSVLHLASSSLSAQTDAQRATSFVDFILLKFPELLESRDHLSRTPLLAAVKSANFAVVSSLLRSGCDVCAQDASGSTALHHAVVADDPRSVANVRLLLRHHDAQKLIGIRTNRGLTALGRCILSLHGNPSLRRTIASHLLSAGSKIEDAVSQSADASLLHAAMRRGHVGPVAFLLEHGISVNIQDSFGNTPLHVACEGGYSELVRLLLSYTKAHLWDDEAEVHAYVQQSNEDGDTALLLAVKSARITPDLVLQLIQYGAEAHVENVKGESALDVAQRRNLREIVDLLLQR